MKSAFYSVLVLFTGVFLLFSCQEEPQETPISVRRLEKEIFAAKSPEELSTILRQNPYLKGYFGVPKDAPDSLIVNQLFTNISSQFLQQFNYDLQKQFGDLETVTTQLQQAFSQIKASYPDFKTPKIVTAVTGFLGSDLYVSDSVIVIGLDYFGGPKAKYRPQVYDYQLHRYRQEYIVPAILFFISQKYNKVPVEDQTLLADMVWYGKGFEFVKHVAPATPDSLIIGYTQAQLDGVYASQQDIWAYFLERKLLFQTREGEKERFIGERPATVEISQYCPGAIGRWVGWRMVSQYLQEKPDTKLTELMALTNVQQLMNESKYKGQKDE